MAGLQRQKDVIPVINTETNAIEEVELIETQKQRQKRLATEARLAAAAERREQKRREEGKQKREKEYMPQAYPWDSVRDYFVQGAPDETGAIYYPTLNDLCDYFHLHPTTVRKKFLEENWIDQRDQWQRSLHKHIQKVTMVDYVAAANKFDSTCVDAAQMAIEEIKNKFLEAKAQDYEISILDLDRMGRAMVNWQRVGRLSLGLSTENMATREQKVDSVEQIELNLLSDDELVRLKQLLQKAESRENDNSVIDAIFEEQSNSQIEHVNPDNSNSKKEYVDTDETHAEREDIKI